VCDWANDEQPYRMKTAQGELYSLPILLELDDLHAMWERRVTVDRYSTLLTESFDVLYRDGAQNGRLLVLHLHPWYIGQPFSHWLPGCGVGQHGAASGGVGQQRRVGYRLVPGPCPWGINTAHSERRQAMQAMVIVPGGDNGTLEFRQVPDPVPRASELLVRVKATALNRADLAQRRGLYPAPIKAADSGLAIAGLEAAGEVVGMGREVTGFAVGDRVLAMCAGAYAELTTVEHRLAVQVPSRLSWEEAAAIPVAYMTEHDALITNGRLQAGESVLINAASSGVGVAAIQIAKFWGARPVMGTSGVPDKLATLAGVGLDVGINYQTENFAEAVLAATNGNGVDVVIDHVGAPYLADNLRCMALRGRLVSVGRLGGGKASLDLDLIALRRLSLIGVTFRTRTLDERIAIAQRFAADLLPALADGRIRPLIHRVFPLGEALEAQGYMASNAQVGKIVLTV
jgi:putative PIG3 family NAD(P)H quinone oxidoreductase